MAIVNTNTNILIPFVDQPDDLTPSRGQVLQTAGSKTTGGAFNIFASATASGDFRLLSLILTQAAQTSASLLTAYVNESDVLGIGATGTAQVLAFPFGAPGLRVGTTTTGTVSAACSGGTSTVYFVATGIRNV